MGAGVAWQQEAEVHREGGESLDGKGDNRTPKEDNSQGAGIDVSVVYCKRKRNILWNVRVFRGIIEALKQQPRPI